MVYAIKLSQSWTGLCNQLFSLANGICKKPENVTDIQIAPFAPEINSIVRVPVSKIINLEKTGQALGLNLHDDSHKSRTRLSFGWYTNNTAKFNMILLAIIFSDPLTQLANRVSQDLGLTTNESWSAIHLRIEPDAIKYWSRQNKMAPSQFEEKLHEKYLQVITENVPRGSRLYILTFDINHDFVKRLANDYTIIGINSQDLVKQELGFTGREACAALDLLVAERCTGTFIGCHNFELNRGSTFSYTLWKRMHNAEKGVFIDLDDIENQRQIIIPN